jgi:hypothetical protein
MEGTIMQSHVMFAGLGLTLGGAIIVAFADLWLSQLLLRYLDALESNVEKLVDAVRTGSTGVVVTGIDVTRDRRQNHARGLKTLGWLAFILGIGIQGVAVYLANQAS